MITVSELYIYPVKSLAGIKLSSSQLSKYGLRNDRRWMIVDNKGRFLSQRETYKMATIRTQIKQNQLVLSHNGSSIIVPETNTSSSKMSVTVWKDSLKCTHIDEKVDRWLSEVLSISCRLVYMDENAKRQIDLDYAEIGQYVSFADAFPLLVISQASLDDLNSRLEESININRFRPNMVVEGVTAYSEDDWQDLSINQVNFEAIKKCSRCIMPSINQTTGERDKTKMLSILRSYRKENNKVKFGQNLIYQNANLIDDQIISCGDEINLK